GPCAAHEVRGGCGAEASPRQRVRRWLRHPVRTRELRLAGAEVRHGDRQGRTDRPVPVPPRLLGVPHHPGAHDGVHGAVRERGGPGDREAYVDHRRLGRRLLFRRLQLGPPLQHAAQRVPYPRPEGGHGGLPARDPEEPPAGGHRLSARLRRDLLQPERVPEGRRAAFMHGDAPEPLLVHVPADLKRRRERREGGRRKAPSIMREGSLSRMVWAVSVPLIFAEVSETILHVTDTMFLARVGTVEVGAVALADTILEMWVVLTVGLVDGIQVLLARRVGQGRDRAVGETFNQGFLLLGAVSIALTVSLRAISPHLTAWLVRSADVGAAMDAFLGI